MKWFTKQSITRIAQWFALMFITFSGFHWWCLFILFGFGVAITTWSIIGSSLLAASATYGLLYWLNNY